MQIDWWTFAAQIINLIILLFLLRKFLYIPVLKAVDARQKLIADELKKAADEHRKAARLMRECERRTAEIETQKQEILATARLEAEKLSARLSAEVEAQYAQERQENKDRLSAEKKRFELAVQGLIGEYFALLAGGALRQMADVSLSDLVIAKFEDKISKMPETEKKALAETLGQKKTVEIQTAQEISAERLSDLQRFLRAQLGLSENVKFKTVIKPELVCGLAIQADEQLISWNFAGYLQTFQRQMDEEMQQLLKGN